MSTIEKALQKQKASNKAEVEKESLASEQVTEQQAEAVAETTPNQAVSEHSPQISLEIDKEQLSARGYLIDTGARKIIKEEFRQVKRKVLSNAFGPISKTLKNSNLIMVTSSKPNEGKTFVSINLALSIALEQDKTVLLVDADVLRPSVIRELGLTPQPGLMEYLQGKVESISDVMYGTNIEKLKLIPSGEPHHLSNELLASERMEQLATELANRYHDRVVIFDSPPLLRVTETPVLAEQMGQGIVVVEESKSRISEVQTALSQLNDDMAVGLVINKAVRNQKDLYGYYGYGYGYNVKD